MGLIRWSNETGHEVIAGFTVGAPNIWFGTPLAPGRSQEREVPSEATGYGMYATSPGYVVVQTSGIEDGLDAVVTAADVWRQGDDD